MKRSDQGLTRRAATPAVIVKRRLATTALTARGRRAETAPLRPAVVAERTRKRWKTPPRSATRTLLTAPPPLAEFVAQALFVFTCTGAACGQATPFSSTNPFDGSKGANSAVGTIDDGSFVPEDLPVPFVQSIAMTFGFTITALAYVKPVEA